MRGLRDELNRKILAYEDAMQRLGAHETLARSFLNYARNEMIEALSAADCEPRRKRVA